MIHPAIRHTVASEIEIAIESDEVPTIPIVLDVTGVVVEVRVKVNLQVEMMIAEEVLGTRDGSLTPLTA